MKTKKVLIVTILIGLVTSAGLKAQESYSNTIGVRLGETSGLTYKHISPTNRAFEAILGYSPDALSITTLAEQYLHTGLSGFSLYFGLGGHVALLTNKYYYHFYENGRYCIVHHEGSVGVGADGMLGVEFKVPVLPFAFSLELKPYMELNTNKTFYVNLDPGLGLKFAF